MAKDGTIRGGMRLGAGRPAKSAAEKALETGEKNQSFFKKNQKISPPKKYLSAPAKKIYREIYGWLFKFGCAELVSPHLVEIFAQATARHIQCEQEISRAGFLIRHPTTGEVLQSPLVKISLDYLKAAQQIWYQIQQVVREHGVDDGGGDYESADTMEKILRLNRWK